MISVSENVLVKSAVIQTKMWSFFKQDCNSQEIPNDFWNGKNSTNSEQLQNLNEKS